MARGRMQVVLAQDKESTVRRPQALAIARGIPQHARAAVLCVGTPRRSRVAVTFRRRWPLVLLALSTLLVALVAAFEVRVNLSSSAPRGIYRVVSNRVTRGALVGACLPSAAARLGLARGYLGAGSCPDGSQPVLKRVGAVAGDVVELAPAQVTVNGTPLPNSATAARDSLARALPHAARGRHTVAGDQVWLFATDRADSWDSRYFGAVTLRDIRGVVRPVLTVP
jgi:conjugative transfer signal peptidase TraF